MSGAEDYPFVRMAVHLDYDWLVEFEMPRELTGFNCTLSQQPFPVDKIHRSAFIDGEVTYPERCYILEKVRSL